MATGILRIQAFAARQSAPVEGVTVNIVGDGPLPEGAGTVKL